MKKGLDPKQGYYRYAATYDDLQKYWDSFEKDYLKPYIEQSKNKKVLDAGAGTGRLSVRLADAGADVIIPERKHRWTTRSKD